MAQKPSTSHGSAAESRDKGDRKVVRPDAGRSSLHDKLAEKAPAVNAASGAAPAAQETSPLPRQAVKPSDSKERPATSEKKSEAARKSGRAVKPKPVTEKPSPPRQKPAKSDDPAPELIRSASRLRPAGPARSKIAANDDVPSIGGLFYALNQKPSNKAYLVATISTVVWCALGLLMSWSVVGTQLSKTDSWLNIFSNPAIIAVAATIVVPIAMFWFIALLIWRAQELKLMSSAMAEVAVRTVSPDRMAEQQVASLGQTVRRQVAAMNDAISRALGRAGELEGIVINEVMVLERSYAENEHRIRGLIDELASEREALANNSERVSEALRGVGRQVAQDINLVTDRITGTMTGATDQMANSLAMNGEKLTTAIQAAGLAIDNRIAERGARITEQIVTHGGQAADRLEQVGRQINQVLHESTERTTMLVSNSGNSVVATLSSMNERIGKEIPGLLERLGGEQVRLSHIIDGATKNLSTLETALSKRTQNIEAAVARQVQAVDSAMVERTKALDAAFSSRIRHLDSVLTKQSDQLNMALIERSEAVEGAMAAQAAAFDETFVRGVEAFRETTERMSNESVRTIEELALQAEVLRDVSEGLLQQVHSLTSRFENRGQSIMKAAHALESSQFKIDSVLDNRQTELAGLLENISDKATNLDQMMRSYSGKLESSLTEAETRAQQLSTALQNNSKSNSAAALAQLEQLKSVTQLQAEKAVSELRSQFSSVAREVTTEISSLTSEFSEITKQVRERAHRAAGELSETQAQIRHRIDLIPNTAREGANAMRKAMEEQIAAVGSLAELASGHASMRDVSPPSERLPEHGRARPGPSGRPPQKPGATRSADPHLQDDERHSQRIDPPRRHAGLRNIDSVVSDVARNLEQNRAHNFARNHPTQPTPPMGDVEDEFDQASHWSMGDLLARASEDERLGARSSRARRARTIDAGPAKQTQPVSQRTLSMDAIARAIDDSTAAELWHRYKSGERGFINRSIYTLDGRATFDEIRQRYSRAPEFRDTVNRYLMDFERLLKEAEKREPGGHLVQNYLTSETGRVYLLLAHASGRLG